MRATVWNLADTKTNLKRDTATGNYEVDDTLTADTANILTANYFGVGSLTQSGTNLIFKNINGVPVEQTVKLFIPVTVTHKWGEMTAYVTVEVRPAQS